ncbi:hypothetical protein ALC57_00420 [Trachymyrmex cornetzi]|uniref:Uncharacterized protein n=1 Tax=Trachymyrmex cornetzi TaxID=471704 RepID=A0A151JRS7_9HYME|nr:hypothetical protein ALC57_00420 [Trachymyrmex cornetzi]
MWQIAEILARRKPKERTMYIAAVRRNDTTRGEMEGRGGCPEGLSLSLLVSGVDFISLVRTGGRKENEEAKGKAPSGEENGAA